MAMLRNSMAGLLSAPAITPLCAFVNETGKKRGHSLGSFGMSLTVYQSMELPNFEWERQRLTLLARWEANAFDRTA